ncbi:hypothetical protein COV18_07480 [Candidatus Woesearchaeota archaeon CG10_big_fil_rev_8_21_14_0_10_37_12]|nr:MAG: hypothetical protein COV18_07480 [Candidatus Woesearchaeota archaeon CG10_big_fil_rev_8_21_14_0_10_37_12]
MVKLNQEDHSRIKKNTIKKLYSNQAFSKGHLLYERLQSGIPTHLQGFVKNILDELIKDELVLIYGKTKYGIAYQLNIKKLKEIEAYLEI